MNMEPTGAALRADRGHPCPWLVCLDLQREFSVPGRPLYSPDAGPQLDTCRQLLGEARARGWSVTHCYTQRTHGLFRNGSQFARPIVGLEPRPSEAVLFRQELSAFTQPRSRSLIEEQGAGEVALIGFSINESLLATALHAADLGLSVCIIEDAVAAPGAGDGELLEAARRLLEPLVTFVRADQWITDGSARGSQAPPNHPH